eukprot:244636-Alexandrium_andersonii.AAC.1
MTVPAGTTAAGTLRPPGPVPGTGSGAGASSSSPPHVPGVGPSPRRTPVVNHPDGPLPVGPVP